MVSVDERWSARWAAVLAHYQRTGRWPSRRQGEPEVALLAGWIAAQRARHKRGVLDPRREQVMRAAGFDLIPRKTTYPREYPAELIEQAFVRYRAGTTTIRELARTSHVKEATIRQWFAAAGEPIRRKGWRRLSVSDERLLELAGQGLTQRQIGDIVDLSDKGVGYRLNRIRKQRDQSA